MIGEVKREKMRRNWQRKGNVRKSVLRALKSKHAWM